MLAYTLKLLCENEFGSVETAAERLAVPADELWDRVLSDASLLETQVF